MSSVRPDLRTPPLPRRLLVLSGRALRLRCPVCGSGRLFRTGFRMLSRCEVCGVRFEREPGYFVGAIYVNYGLTSLAVLGTALSLDACFGLDLSTLLPLAITGSILLPVLFFRHARSFWLALDFLCNPERPPLRLIRPQGGRTR